MKHYLHKILLVFSFSILSLSMFSQTKTVSGTIKDSNGVPLPGVNIVIKETGQGTQSDFDGNYSIQAEQGTTIVFSYVGTKTISKIVGDQKTYNITMEQSSAELDEVVVVGYGTQKKSNVVGSIASVSEESIKDRPVARIEQALQGQMAGVTIRNTSGKPGSDISINVRGASSINGDSSPLYVVDGVPIDNLSGINPNDIASIDVLKDAASAAIYGSRGSNGVVLITTKRGREGKPTISLTAYTGFSQVEKNVDVMTSDEWIQFNKKWYDRQWSKNTGMPASTSQSDRIAYATSQTGDTYDTREQLATIRNAYGIYDPYWGTNAIEKIDWQDAIFRTAPIYNVQLSASGAYKNINYYLSGAFIDQDGVIEGSSFKRYSMNSYVNAKINDKLEVGLKISPSFSKGLGGNVSGKNRAVSRALSFPGWVPAGSGNMAGAEPYKFYDLWGPGANNVSPYARATIPSEVNKDIRMNSALTADYSIIEGLNLKGLLGWNSRTNSYRSYDPTSAQGGWDQADPGELSSSRKTTYISNNLLLQSTLNYEKKLEDHNFGVLLGASRETFNASNTDQAASNFPDDKTYVFDRNRGKNINRNAIGYSENAIVSFFGRLNYDFKDKYLFTASLRSDGSSKFGSDSRWGWFPSLSGAWKVIEEPFLQKANWLGDAKLRVSWGEAGNDRIGNAKFLSNMQMLNYPYGDSQEMQSGYVVGNIANSSLGWEKTSSYNFGIDLGFFHNRIYLSLDYYTKKTNDLLLNAPVSLTTGFDNLLDNVGNVENKGLEIELNTINFRNKNFTWKTNLNVYFNRNEITSLGSEDADIRLGLGGTIIQRVGEPINSYYLLKAKGVLRAADFEADGVTPKDGVAIYTGQRPGGTKWEDINNDGKIDSEDYTVAGSYQPDFEWGLTNTFSYKNFDMSILLQGRVGGDLLSSGTRSWNRATSDPRYLYMEQWLSDAYWSEDDPGNGKVPAFFSAVTSQYDTNWLYSAGYFRIKNITIGYTIPFEKTMIKDARLYVSTDNVFIWDNFYPGYSPEGATQDNASSSWGSYPQSRTVSFGVNINF